MNPTRTERDSMGEMQVPADALYGASTARALQNFPIAHRPLPPAFIHAYGHLKAACAQANKDLGKLPGELADAIIAAAEEVASGMHDAHFPVDVYQTGSGTSTNTNVNEVIASLANRKLKPPLQEAHGVTPWASGDAPPSPRIHPNDHVNMGQSSNDTFPTAMHIAGALALENMLRPALSKLHIALSRKADAYDVILKTGRTHLMDATPIRLGQVFSGYADQVSEALEHYSEWAREELEDRLAIGGTAVGTGINTHPDFASRVADALTHKTGFEFHQDAGPKANASKDNFIQAHAYLKTIATCLSKIANDIRLMGSGPRCGIGELILPAIQPGSSIMPGKVNPVLCESVMQVCCRVIGNDATVTMAGMGGVGSIFELNVAMPVMIDAFLESVTLLSNASNVFAEKVVDGLQVDEKRCGELLERSLMNVTALAPVLGYDTCASIAKQAHMEDKSIRQIVLERGLLDTAKLDDLLDYEKMTRPSE